MDEDALESRILQLTQNIPWPNIFGLNDETRILLVQLMIYHEILAEELLVFVTRKHHSNEGRQKRRQLFAIEDAESRLLDVKVFYK